MAMGMSYDEYWNGDIFKALDYVEAYKLQRKRKNMDLWIQGLYIQDALYSALWSVFSDDRTNAPKYPDKPYPLFSDEIESAEEEKKKQEAQYAENYMQQLLAWGKEINGET